ncbi:NAD(P)/FAD-dependent oxidoreductase [Candidatus Poriferisodalis sp.]|uniref:NAD(P)/FAD-dependent oxidoreductase n=1 Tax=Candidatus Poriferisodalis sp. TaxID=3101277 RepID=UPI003AF9CDE7
MSPGSNRPERIVVVGASLAGARAAHSIRAAGHDGALTLIGAESHLPYDRPPLSKEFLTGEREALELMLDADGAYDELGVEVMVGTAAVGLDLENRTVAVAPAVNGSAGGDSRDTVPFDALVIATGAAARPLPGTEGIEGVHTLRTLDDSTAIREGLVAGARVAVVGGGFIGSEVAASAKARGCEVTVIEAASAPLVRGLGAEMGTRVGALHDQNGVELRLGVGVEGVLGTDRVEAVAMADDSRIEADLVVVGIGVVPNTAWLESSGLRIDNGVVCDATLCCGPPGVYAVGDVARAPNRWLSPWHGEAPIRVEHWTAAVEHGMAVGRNLMAPDEAQPYDSVPFVWSDQYDARIQVAGHPDADDDVEVLVGSASDRSFLAGYRRDGRLSAVMALDSIRPFVRFRRLLAGHPTWDEALELAATLR